VNEEQRKQRDLRVLQLAASAVEASEVAGVLAAAELADLRENVQIRLNLALDEQAKQIAAAIQARAEWLRENRQTRTAEGCADAGELAAGFGDDR
jgi:hypothetical protein